MHILRVVWDWPPPWSGLAPGPYDLTKAQIARGHTVTVLTGGWPRRKKAELAGGTVISLPSGIPGVNMSVFFVPAPLALIAFLLYRLQHPVQIIHAHGQMSVLFLIYKKVLGWLDHTPLYVHLHIVAAERARKIREQGQTVSFLTNLEWRLHAFTDRLALEIADAVCVPAESMRQEILAHYHRDENVVVVPNGVDTEAFTPDGAIYDLEVPEDAKVLLFVGSLSKRKNPDYVIRALKALPDTVHAVFAGTGEMADALLALANELDLSARCHFLGRVERTALPTLFRAADVFVLPSLSEGYPKVVLEALATGLPVVASGFDIGTTFDGQLTIIDPEIEALVDAVEEAMGKKVPKDALERVRSMISWDSVANTLDSIYVPT